MDFWRTVLVILRRWYVVLPAFALSVGSAALVYATMPAHYTSGSVLVLTSPTTGGSLPADPDIPTGVVNPLLNFNQGLSTSAAILIQALNAPEVAAEIGVSPDSPTTYRVSNGSSNPELLTSGPFVFIVGESPSAHEAADIVRRVADQARVELRARQAAVDAPEQTYIEISVVAPATTPEAKRGSKSRATAAALGIGFVASLFAAFATESIALAWRRRRAQRAPTHTEPHDPVTQADTRVDKAASGVRTGART